jgi:hypothetical protein
MVDLDKTDPQSPRPTINVTKLKHSALIYISRLSCYTQAFLLGQMSKISRTFSDAFAKDSLFLYTQNVSLMVFVEQGESFTRKSECEPKLC